MTPCKRTKFDVVPQPDSLKKLHLEEEDEGHPLIVGVHGLLASLGSKSRVSTA